METSVQVGRLEQAAPIKNQLPMVVMFAQKMGKGLI